MQQRGAALARTLKPDFPPQSLEWRRPSQLKLRSAEGKFVVCVCVVFFLRTLFESKENRLTFHLFWKDFCLINRLTRRGLWEIYLWVWSDWGATPSARSTTLTRAQVHTHKFPTALNLNPVLNIFRWQHFSSQTLTSFSSAYFPSKKKSLNLEKTTHLYIQRDKTRVLWVNVGVCD